MSIASHGQPSRNAPSGPLLVHNLHPMQSSGSTIIRPNGAWSSSGAQYMQSATGQYSTHAGDPAHPVQHSLITARMCGLRLRCVVVPVDFGSYLTTVPCLNSSMLGAPYATKTSTIRLRNIFVFLPTAHRLSICQRQYLHALVILVGISQAGDRARRSAPVQQGILRLWAKTQMFYGARLQP